MSKELPEKHVKGCECVSVTNDYVLTGGRDGKV